MSEPDWSRWGIRYLDHLALTTPDLSGTLAAYLALPGSRLERGPGHNDRQRVDYAFVRLGDGLRLELLSGGADSPVAAHLARGGGPYHLCFAVDDLERAVQAAEREGARILVTPTPDPAFDGRRIAFVLHPGHGLLELLDARPGDSRAGPAAAPGAQYPPARSNERLAAVMAEVFPVLDPHEYADAALERTPGWDSLTHLQLMMAVERSFAIRIPTEEMQKVTDFETLQSLVKRLAES